MRDQNAKKREEIAEAIDEMNRCNVVIDSVASVQQALSYGMDIEAKLSLIRSVMKKDLGMKFKRIKSISNQGNSPRNLVLRQQFALKLIQLMTAGKTIINIDET